jgi:hypothetical protein
MNWKSAISVMQASDTRLERSRRRRMDVEFLLDLKSLIGHALHERRWEIARTPPGRSISAKWALGRGRLGRGRIITTAAADDDEGNQEGDENRRQTQ